jgi:hypothetical protein
MQKKKEKEKDEGAITAPSKNRLLANSTPATSHTRGSSHPACSDSVITA